MARYSKMTEDKKDIMDSDIKDTVSDSETIEDSSKVTEESESETIEDSSKVTEESESETIEDSSEVVEESESKTVEAVNYAKIEKDLEKKLDEVRKKRASAEVFDRVDLPLIDLIKINRATDTAKKNKADEALKRKIRQYVKAPGSSIYNPIIIGKKK